MLWERGKAYSQDLRERVFVEADDGAEVGEIATILRVSVVCVEGSGPSSAHRRGHGPATTMPTEAEAGSVV